MKLGSTLLIVAALFTLFTYGSGKFIIIVVLIMSSNIVFENYRQESEELRRDAKINSSLSSDKWIVITCIFLLLLLN